MRDINLNNERAFENRKARGEGVRAAQGKFYWATEIPTAIHKRITCDEIKGKLVLEIGCASGKDAADYCRYAERYIGVDISDKAIANCESLKLDSASFWCIDGHILPVPDDSLDGVIVSSLLHHMDLITVFNEIKRVLKPGGILCFREPLGTNPIFTLYRAITPSARTVDERPFSRDDLRLMRRYFELEKICWFGFTNILSAYTGSSRIRRVLTGFDDLLSKTPIRFLFWQISGLAKIKK